MKIALATCQEVPTLFKHEQQLVPFFQQKGLQVATPIWNAPNIDWQTFDAVFIRSTWDYHLHIAAFKRWLQHLNTLGVAVYNPIEIQLQNMHKFYLKQLEERGISIVPTAFIPKTASVAMVGLFERWGTQKIIIKPAQSAGAYLTTLWSKEELEYAEATFKKLNAKQDVLIQPFQEAIMNEGEWSLMFYHNQFSHAVLKQTSPGDFRVQEEFGGQYQLVLPEPWVIEAAEKVLQRFSRQPLPYARVDGVMVNEQFLLMELELIEPELFLFTEELLTRFGNAMLACIT